MPDLGLILQSLAETSGRLEAMDRERESLVRERDGMIRSARTAGATYQQLADETGLSRTMLDRIINGRVCQ